MRSGIRRLGRPTTAAIQRSTRSLQGSVFLALFVALLLAIAPVVGLG